MSCTRVFKKLNHENIKNQNYSTDFVKFNTLLPEKYGNNPPKLNKNENQSYFFLNSKKTPKTNIRKKLIYRINKDKLFNIDKTLENVLSKNNNKKSNYLNLKISNVNTKTLFLTKYKNKFNDILPKKNNNKIKIGISIPISTRANLPKTSKQYSTIFKQKKTKKINSCEKRTTKKFQTVRSKSNIRLNQKINDCDITLRKYCFVRSRFLYQNNNKGSFQESTENSKSKNVNKIDSLAKNNLKNKPTIKNIKITRIIRENQKNSRNNNSSSKDSDINQVLEYIPKNKNKFTMNNQKNGKLEIININLKNSSLNEKNETNFHTTANIFENPNIKHDLSDDYSIPALITRGQKEIIDKENKVNINVDRSSNKKHLIKNYEYDYDLIIDDSAFNNKLMKGPRISIRKNIIIKGNEVDEFSLYEKKNEQDGIRNKTYDVFNLKDDARNITYDIFQNTKIKENSLNKNTKEKQTVIQNNNNSFKQKFRSLSKKRDQLKLLKQKLCIEDHQFDLLSNKLSSIIIEIKKMNK